MPKKCPICKQYTMGMPHDCAKNLARLNLEEANEKEELFTRIKRNRAVDALKNVDNISNWIWVRSRSMSKEDAEAVINLASEFTDAITSVTTHLLTGGEVVKKQNEEER